MFIRVAPRLAVALASFVVGCDSPFLRSIEPIEPANDGGSDCAPAPPQTLNVTPGEDSLALDWVLNGEDRAGVLIERRESGTTWGELVQLGPTSTQFDDFSVERDTTYKYRVLTFRLLDQELCSSFPSNEASSVTPPNPVSNLEIEFSAGEITLTWTDPNSTTTEYSVERSLDGGAFSSAGPQTSATQFTDNSVSPQTTATFRVAALNAAGASEFEEVTLVTPLPPSLAWDGAPSVGPQCLVSVPGVANFDTANDVSIASATARFGRASSNALGGEFGIEAVLEDLTPGEFEVAWELTDSSGYTEQLTRTLAVETTSTNRVANEVPNLSIGWTTGHGQQPINVGCSTCSGRRASLASGPEGFCAVLNDGSASCWGFNRGAGLGRGPNWGTVRPSPVCADTLCATEFIADQIHSSDTSACGRLGSELFCWGQVGRGQLGGGTDDGFSRVRPQQVCRNDGSDGCDPLQGVIDFNGEGDTRCAVTAPMGEVFCWGENNSNKTFTEPNSSLLFATRVCLSGSDSSADCVPLTGALSVDVGSEHQCAVMNDGTAMCWGYNDEGQLGFGIEESNYFPPQPVCAPGVALTGATCGALDERLTGISDVHAAEDTSCARLTGGEVLCWGDNDTFQLGDGTSDDRPSPGPVCLSGTSDGLVCQGGAALNDSASLFSGEEEGFCVIRTDETALCWGYFSDGPGDGIDESSRNSLRQICRTGSHEAGTAGCLDGATPSPMTEIKTMSLGRTQTCLAVGDVGETLCSGFGGYGLGRNSFDFDDTFLPEKVCIAGSGPDCTALSATSLGHGDNAGCAISPDGIVRCWGDDSASTLGFGNPSTIPYPRPICEQGIGTECMPLSGVQQVAKTYLSGCALLDDGEVRCWGAADYGVLGNGHDRITAPVLELENQRLCASGIWNGTACNNGAESTPPLGDFAQLSAGFRFLCGLTNSGTVYCWGENDDGQVGIPPATSEVLNPRQVACAFPGSGCEVGQPLSGIASVAAGSFHACAIHESGDTWCWGLNNEGQLGNGNRTSSSSPVPVVSTVPFTQLAPGSLHTCAIGIDRRAYCWGDDFLGQLGNGAQAADGSLSPVVVCESGQTEDDSCVPLEGVVQLVSRTFATCALLEDGRAVCWGDNEEGRMGTGQADFRLIQSNPASPCARDAATPNCTDDYSCSAPLDDRFVSLSMSNFSTCGIREDGAVVCWGPSDSGSSGDGRTTAAFSSTQCTPTQVCDLDDFSCAGTLASSAVRTCNVVSLSEVQ